MENKKLQEAAMTLSPDGDTVGTGGIGSGGTGGAGGGQGGDGK